MQKLSGREYIMVDIANQMGYDRACWANRIGWVDANMTDLENISDTAKYPVLFRKAVRALRACDRGEAIGFPMSLDATASGLQLYAVLTGCVKTAMNVNLAPTGKREDIYQKIADEMNKLTGKAYSRNDLKIPIMTVFYGSRMQPEIIFGEASAELAAFYTLIYRELPGAMDLMRAIQSFWNPNVLEHSWIMPDKHVVHAKVIVAVDKKIEIDELAHKTFTHRASVNMPQKRGLSLAANVIHSIDGYVVREMVRRAKKSGFELATIHDSFWAHPNNMNAVRHLYVQLLAEMASENIIQNILQQLQPGWGSFTKSTQHLNKVILQADYAIS